MAAMAEQPAYGIRVVAERNNRSNDGCVEMATGGSWPIVLIAHRAGKPPVAQKENNQTPINNEGV